MTHCGTRVYKLDHPLILGYRLYSTGASTVHCIGYSKGGQGTRMKRKPKTAILILSNPLVSACLEESVLEIANKLVAFSGECFVRFSDPLPRRNPPMW